LNREEYSLQVNGYELVKRIFFNSLERSKLTETSIRKNCIEMAKKYTQELTDQLCMRSSQASVACLSRGGAPLFMGTGDGISMVGINTQLWYGDTTDLDCGNNSTTVTIFARADRYTQWISGIMATSPNTIIAMGDSQDTKTASSGSLTSINSISLLLVLYLLE